MMMSSGPETEALAEASLAAPVAASAAPGEQFLTFAVGGEAYAAQISAIREILEVPAITAVPLVPDVVRGVINLRGSVVPVIDLLRRFDYAATTLARRSCVVVVEIGASEDAAAGEAPGTEHQLIGMLVDAVNEVIEIREAEIEQAPALGTRIRPEFIRGVAVLPDGLLVVLALGRVLAPAELAQLVEAHAGR